MANPRIDDLRKRLDKEPGSRLFAQLAEELRKDGSLEEAIEVCREGLARHPAYPSARMTLGRALFDRGDVAAARVELETVLRGAPDNILASRLLAECLEGAGDLPGAAAQYEATLRLSPGDRSLVARLADLKRAPAATAAPDGSAPAGELPPIPLASVDDDAFELERPYEAGSVVRTGGEGAAESSGGAPDAGAPEDDGFVIERSYEPPVPVRPAPPAPPAAAEAVFEVDRGYDIPTALPAIKPFEQARFYRTSNPVAATWDDPVLIPESAGEDEALETMPALVEMPAAPEAPEPVAPPAPVAVAPIAPAPGSSPELLSATLAELYQSQGLHEKAVEVYKKMSSSGQGGPRVRERLAELEARHRGGGHAGPPAERRAAIERTIGRLEEFLAVIRRG